MARVIITGPAQRDIQAAYDWWEANRSAEQAKRWYIGIHAAIRSLKNNPERCAMATESDLWTQGIRQLLFGLQRRPTHRVVFAIDGEIVVVLRVRHASQDALSPDDLRV
ncbi:MAG: type II toxin-antitoxin system RelE/ParE family toxin [Pirellulales bacterium]